jgi:uncharacterized phage-associated protein
MTKKNDILTIAQYLVCRYTGELTPMKLQKLLYYIKCWSLVAKQPLIDEPFEAWTYGPVNSEVYHWYKVHGNQPLPAASIAPHILFESLVNFIADSYNIYSAAELSRTTNTEEPWKLAMASGKENVTIEENLIIKYYSKQPFAKNFPLLPGADYIAPSTNASAAYFFDMSTDEAATMNTYLSIDQYLGIHRETEERLKQYE